MSTAALSIVISIALMVAARFLVKPPTIVVTNTACSPCPKCECEPKVCVETSPPTVPSELTMLQAMQSIEDARQGEMKAVRELQAIRRRIEDSKRKWADYAYRNTIQDNEPYHNCTVEIREELDNL